MNLAEKGALYGRLPAFLQPKLRLFLSVDIVNSTAFKQASVKDRKTIDRENTADANPVEPWFSPINRFYREIERSFSNQWTRLSDLIDKRHSWPVGEKPELWKAAGDELLYVKTLSDHRQALVTVGAWIKAVEEHRKDLRTRYPTLDLKAAAWLAGFPVNNAEVILKSEMSAQEGDIGDGDAILSNLCLLDSHYTDPGKGFRDFIGPSIDTGFRVSALATSRKMALTVDLAMMLAHTVINQPVDEDFPVGKIKFHYDGRVPLKGVFDGSPYPFFWIDTRADDSLYSVEDRILNAGPIDGSAVKEFCELFIAKQSIGYMTKPFIKDSTDPLYQAIPEYHTARLEHLADYWEKEPEKRRAEREALGDESPAPAVEGGEQTLGDDEVEELSRLALTPSSPTPDASNSELASVRERDTGGAQ